MQVTDPSKLLNFLRSQPTEREWLEFKENNFSAKSIGKYISALANSATLAGKDCAYLVFGVENDGHEIVGTHVRIEEEMVGNDTFLFWVSRQIDPKLTLHVESIDIGDKHVEMLLIEPTFQQPVEFEGEAFVRIGAAVQPLKKYPDRLRSLWTMSARYAFEDAVATSNVSGDWALTNTLPKVLIDGLKISRTTAEGVIDLLISEGMLRDNFEGGLDATNLLGLTIAKDFSSWPTIGPKAPRVVTYKGTSKQSAENDETGALGYAAGFPKLLAYIMERTSKREEMVHGLRQTIYAIPAIAIREFLANALVHQDLTERDGGPLIEIFKDRIRIINPGAPLIDPDRFIDSPPRSRNPKLGTLMRRLGICEQRGSGVDRALRAIEDQMLPAPVFEVIGSATSVTVFGPKPFADLSPEDRVRACYQHACVQQERNDPMSNSTLRVRFGLPEKQYPQISVVIRDAIDAGRIRPLNQDQANRIARYVPFWA